MNVSVFGNTMENLRKHRNKELVHTRKRLAKLSAKPTYKTTCGGRNGACQSEAVQALLQRHVHTGREQTCHV